MIEYYPGRNISNERKTELDREEARERAKIRSYVMTKALFFFEMVLLGIALLLLVLVGSEFLVFAILCHWISYLWGFLILLSLINMLINRRFLPFLLWGVTTFFSVIHFQIWW